MADLANQVPRGGFAIDGRPESARVQVPGGPNEASVKVPDTAAGAGKDI